jgi:predicted ATP-grasp superfamily ATP-dependent carboligase
VPRDCYLQEFVEGTPASIVFIAAGGQATPLGVSRQLIGDAAFGVSGYRYCGNILAPMHTYEAAADLARQAAAAFGLVGVNGIDFIERHGAAVPIEINPRWSASMELVERAHGISVFAAHVAACTRGELPSSQSPKPWAESLEPQAQSPTPRALGKAIVFAREDVQLGDTRAWLADSSVADVPQPGQRIARGRPICTVFAEGDDDAACYAALVSRARAVYASVAAREGVAW